MHQVKYHKRALKSLNRIPKFRANQVLDAVDALALLKDPTEDPNVKMMRDNWKSTWRLRVGEYRAIFELRDSDKGEEVHLIYVTHAGTRGEIYG